MSTMVASFAPHIIAQTEYTEPPQEAVSTYDLSENQVSEEIPLATDDELIDSSSYEETPSVDESISLEETQVEDHVSLEIDESLDETVGSKEESIDLTIENSVEAVDVVSPATTTAYISDWFLGDLTTITDKNNDTTTISGQVDLAKMVEVAKVQSNTNLNGLSINNIVQRTEMTLKWAFDPGVSGTVEISKHTGAFTIKIKPAIEPPKEILFHIDELKFKGDTKDSFLEFEEVTQYLQTIDVITSASTTANIDDWVILNPSSISQTSTSISGKIDVNRVYEQVIEQAGWEEAETTLDIIAEQFENQYLQLLIDGEIRQTILLKNTMSERNFEYPFEFTELDLSASEKVTFQIVGREIVFWGVPKPSIVIMNDVTVSLDTSSDTSPFGFGSVGDFKFEPQTFSYHLGNKTIEQYTPLEIEIIGSNSSAYSLSASNSGTLHYENIIVNIELLYDEEPIGETPVNIFKGTSTKPLIFKNFKLRISDPSQIVAGQDYTTTITWTLTNAN